MTLPPTRLATVFVAMTFALAACEEFQGTSRSEEEAAVSLGPDAPRTEVRDVERADIFSVTESGLWDGRPSLGGVWIAHPDVVVPARVKITNTSTGETIAGALFRRERANPGPRIQVSSDAAAELGMLAGKPQELSIVVVRQETIELEPEPLPLSDETDGPDAETDSAAEDADASDVAAAAAGAAAATEAPKRRGFWSRFREGFRKKPAAEVAEDADTALIEETTDSAAPPEVETAPLDPVASAAAAAIDEAEGTEQPPARALRPKDTGVKNPFIQVGLFSVEENASAAAASLRQAGIVPQIRGQQSNGKTLWRIFVGPVSNTEDQAALLAQIKSLGYADAFLAPN